MIAVRMRRHLDSETLTLPELRPLLGKDIELIALSDSDSEAVKIDDAALEARRRELHGTLIKDEDPFGPAVPPEDWEALQ